MDIKRTLEEEARRCQWLVLWLDCDREGENIAFEVVQVCTAANSRLTIKRARFSALIDRFSLDHNITSIFMYMCMNISYVCSGIFLLCLIFFICMIFREIHQAVQNLVEPNKLFADAVDARQVSTFAHLLYLEYAFISLGKIAVIIYCYLVNSFLRVGRKLFVLW